MNYVSKNNKKNINRLIELREGKVDEIKNKVNRIANDSSTDSRLNKGANKSLKRRFKFKKNRGVIRAYSDSINIKESEIELEYGKKNTLTVDNKKYNANEETMSKLLVKVYKYLEERNSNIVKNLTLKEFRQALSGTDGAPIDIKIRTSTNGKETGKIQSLRIVDRKEIEEWIEKNQTNLLKLADKYRKKNKLTDN